MCLSLMTDSMWVDTDYAKQRYADVLLMPGMNDAIRGSSRMMSSAFTSQAAMCPTFPALSHALRLTVSAAIAALALVAYS